MKEPFHTASFSICVSISARFSFDPASDLISHSSIHGEMYRLSLPGRSNLQSPKQLKFQVIEETTPVTSRSPDPRRYLQILKTDQGPIPFQMSRDGKISLPRHLPSVWNIIQNSANHSSDPGMLLLGSVSTASLIELDMRIRLIESLSSTDAQL